jgi:hypothetical protein
MTGEEVIKVKQALDSERLPMDNHWDELSELFMPFRLAEGGKIDVFSADTMHDSEPRQCALVLANGLASLVTPREEKWFEYQPPRELRKVDAAIKYYRECSVIARDYIESSNFYEEMQECYIASPVFGTAALFCGDLDEFGELHFSHINTRTFSIGESAKGRVNCITRDLSYTADQALEEYGREELPTEIANMLGTSRARTEKHDFVHLVCKREVLAEDRKRGKKKASLLMPWMSIVVHVKTKKIVQETGYVEFPFAVHRYRKFGECVWGFGPGFTAKGDSRQLSFLNDLADAATEIQIFSPVIAPASLEGEIARGPHEITYYDDSDPNHGAGLREWRSGGRIDIADHRIEDKRMQIRKAFHVDLFNLFSNRLAGGGTPPSATESSLAAGEKLTQFSPVYGRLVSEMLDVILSRVFGVLARAGKMPQPPAEIVKTDGKNNQIPFPSVLYSNKIVLAQQARENGSLMEFFNFAAPIIQASPQTMDAIKGDVLMRRVARNCGLPEDVIRTPKEIEEISNARAMAAQQNEQLAQADAAAGVAQKLAGMPPAQREQMARAMGQQGNQS